MSAVNAASKRPLEGGASFTLSNRMLRGIWMVTWGVLASWTPPPLHRWRRVLLLIFGARIAPGARVYGSARIWYPPNLIMGKHAVLGPGAICYNQTRIEIGELAIVSQRAHLCTGSHDIRDPEFPLITSPIAIGPRAWVAAEAFVGPGVNIGEGAVLGARGCAFRSLKPWTIYGSNPAREIGMRVLPHAP